MALTNARRLLVLGAVVSVFGIALAGIVRPSAAVELVDMRTLGGIVTLLGWAALLAGLHAFGRAGAA